MFDRFILASNFKRIESRFSMAKLPELIDYNPSYNIATGDKSYIINNNQTKEILLFEFGLRVNDEVMPFVRAEGNRNLEDNPHYKGSKAIFLLPEFNRLIRFQRCLVLADAFIVGIDDKPHLVYLRDKKRPFAFAGIWNNYFDDEVGEEMNSFAIITTTANQLIQKLGYKRMPVILFPEYENRWIRPSTELFEVLNMLNPFPADLMNAFPIASYISDTEKNDISMVQPIGKTVYNEQISYQKTPRLGKKEEDKIHLTLTERAKTGNN